MPPVNLGWLKTVGKFLAMVGGAAAGIDLSSFFPSQYKPLIDKVEDYVGKSHLAEVGNVIIQVEAFSAALSSPLPGAEKLKAATPPVANIMLDFFKIRHMEIENESEFLLASSEMTSAMVRAFNSCKAPK